MHPLSCPRTLQQQQRLFLLKLYFNISTGLWAMTLGRTSSIHTLAWPSCFCFASNAILGVSFVLNYMTCAAGFVALVVGQCVWLEASIYSIRVAAIVLSCSSCYCFRARCIVSFVVLLYSQRVRELLHYPFFIIILACRFILPLTFNTSVGEIFFSTHTSVVLRFCYDIHVMVTQYHNFRLIQSVYSMLKSTSGKYQDSSWSPVHIKGSNEQSILEMASINSSLAKETLDLSHNVLPAFTLAETSLLLTHESQKTTKQLQMEPTSAEKLALQVKPVW